MSESLTMTAMNAARVRGKVPTSTLGGRLILMRHELRVSQRDAAAATGVPYGTWQGMENDRATRSLDKWVRKIHDTYGYDMNWLMWGIAPEDSPGASVTGRKQSRVPAQRLAA